MYGINDLVKGVLIELNGEPYQITYSEHSKLGRGGGMQRVKMKNLLTGNALEQTFKGADKIQPAKITTSSAQYLYAEGDKYHFMDSKNYEQFALTKEDIGESADYLIAGTDYPINYYHDRPIKIELPIKVKLKVAEAETGLRGDTSTSPSKVVTLETGLKLNVPLFIKKDDFVLVDSRTGEYAGRV